jgi:hypothetical protein
MRRKTTCVGAFISKLLVVWREQSSIQWDMTPHTGNSHGLTRSSTKTAGLTAPRRASLGAGPERVAQSAPQRAAAMAQPPPRGAGTDRGRDKPVVDKSTTFPLQPTTIRTARHVSHGAMLLIATAAHRAGRSAGYHHARHRAGAVPLQQTVLRPAAQLPPATSQPCISWNHPFVSSKMNCAQVPFNLSTTQLCISPTANNKLYSHFTDWKPFQHADLPQWHA